MNGYPEFEEKIYEYIIKENLFTCGESCIVGISGGADSVCLLNVLSELKEKLGISLYAVHVNHMIRGAEADSDESYVKECCEKLGIPFKAFHIDVPSLAKEEGLTLEEAGRKARYEAFSVAASEFETENYKIAVAHNKNDLAETLILNMARGTGIAGIKGIPAKRENIVRPLLCAERKEIEAYLDKSGIKYCTDSTNLSDDYTRNKIRHNIIPELMLINSGAVSHMEKLAETASEYERYVNSHVEKFIVKNVAEKTLASGGKTIEVGINALKQADNLIENLVILKLIEMAAGSRKDIGESHVNEVKKLYTAKSGSLIMLPYGVRVVNNYGSLQFICAKKSDKPDSDKKEWVIPAREPGIYTLPHGLGTIKIEIFDKPVNIDLTKKEYTKFVDYDKIQNGITIRNYMEDDYMVIDGKGHTKKLTRLFSSCKVPSEDRPYIPLVASGHEVIWAVGVRLGENYKISENTKRIVKFEYFTK